MIEIGNYTELEVAAFNSLGGIYELDLSINRDQFLDFAIEAVKRLNIGLFNRYNSGDNKVRIACAYTKPHKNNAWAWSPPGCHVIAFGVDLADDIGARFQIVLDSKVFQKRCASFNMDEQLVVKSMMRLAVLFIWLHECGHINHGHTRLIYASGNRSAFGEFEFDGKLFGSDADRPTMEMDADSHAVTRVAALGLSLGADLRVRGNSLTGSLIGDLYTVILSSLILFGRFGGNFSPSQSEIIKLTHPPAFYRLELQAGILNRFLVEENRIISNDDFKNSIKMAGEDGLHILNEIKPFKRDLVGEFPLNQETYFVYRKQILQNWGRLRPFLVPLLIAGQLAPAQTVQEL